MEQEVKEATSLANIPILEQGSMMGGGESLGGGLDDARIEEGRQVSERNITRLVSSLINMIVGSRNSLSAMEEVFPSTTTTIKARENEEEECEGIM